MNPLIEDHYHIKELIKGQEKRADDREYHRNKLKTAQERDEEIKDSKLVVVTDFWCPICKEDFKSMSIKETEQDWTNSTQYIAFYRSKCSQGHWCIRHITDKYKDGFWTRSKSMVVDRGKHFNDIVQPHETGFKLLYGHKTK